MRRGAGVHPSVTPDSERSEKHGAGGGEIGVVIPHRDAAVHRSEASQSETQCSAVSVSSTGP